MASHVFYACTISFVTFLLTLFIRRYLSDPETGPSTQEATDPSTNPLKPDAVCARLARELPHRVILPNGTTTFPRFRHPYWAQQESEVAPACIVRPEKVEELCTVISVLKQEFDNRRRESRNASKTIFAVRAGGHSAVHGAAAVNNGVVIDLSLFREVILSEDGRSVIIGAGAKWGDVSKVLDEKGLAVVGGRNSDVGVGGLTLGGGLSFFSPRHGMVCSNITSYEIVLASGCLVTASATSNPDLWRALKGGSNNFGIVTRFTARGFPATNVWSGFLYMPAYQADKTVVAFHEFVDRVMSKGNDTRYDDHAASPLACFSYIHQVGIQVISLNLVHTAPPENQKQWPACWRDSAFSKLWRFWSTCKVRTLTDATNELHSLNPPGRRQILATTTIRNDLKTLNASHLAYREGIASIRRLKIKGISWTLVLQPLIPEWGRKGDPNPLGLDEGDEEPLVIISFTVNWPDSRHDIMVEESTRQTIERIDRVAAANDAGHRYRYLNYCAAWQKPFEGYGEVNHQFLKDTSKKYDPDGLFQVACNGGFKLDIKDLA